MKALQTISEYQLLNAAYDCLLEKYLIARERFGEIAEHKIALYKSQLDELHTRIIEIEKGE